MVLHSGNPGVKANKKHSATLRSKELLLEPRNWKNNDSFSHWQVLNFLEPQKWRLLHFWRARSWRVAIKNISRNCPLLRAARGMQKDDKLRQFDYRLDPNVLVSPKQPTVQVFETEQLKRQDGSAIWQPRCEHQRRASRNCPLQELLLESRRWKSDDWFTFSQDPN